MTKPAAPDSQTLELAADFPAADPNAWLTLVEKSLGGRPYEKLASKSYDGLTIKTLYTADPSAPNTGVTASGATQSGWDVRCVSSHPDPSTANKQILADLEKGAASVWLKLDPTGRTGTVIKSRGDLETLLDGVFLDLARFSLCTLVLHVAFEGLNAFGDVAHKAGYFAASAKKDQHNHEDNEPMPD